jgi:hypothetical protein
VISINILARLQEAPSEVAAPFVDELTSAAALAVAFLIPGLVVHWIRRSRPSILIRCAVLLVGLPVFAAIHLGGCVALRALFYPMLLGRAHDFDLTGSEMPFEVAKDIIAYSVSAGGFAVILGWWPSRARLAPTPSNAAVTFDIQDGSRLIRTPVAEILAVRSAGNYVEFQLSDGRRPLMRTSLNGLHDMLKNAGFVRTHRSWLVNVDRVTGLRPEGSGDYAIELGDIEAPLSRRFPAALAVLRG